MEETQNENLDSTNEGVQVDTEETTVADTETEQSEEVDVTKVLETNKKLYKRLKDTEAKLKQIESKPKDSTLQTPADTGSVYEQVKLLKDIEEDEMNSLESDAKDLGVPVLKYIKSTAGKTRLDVIRKEKRSKDASPEIGSASPVYKKHTQEELGKMSVAELQKIIPQ